MGTWGTGIFQNDVADGVKTTYISKLRLGKSDKEAFEETISENAELLSDNEDTVDFWFALSSVMYDHGRLNEEVRRKAMALLDSDNDLERWDEKEYGKRKNELEKLKAKLCSGSPPRKKVAVVKRFECQWKKNDIYFAEIKAICDSEKEGFFVFCVCDTVGFDARIKGLGDILPITYLKIAPNIPYDLKKIDDLPFVMNRRDRKDHRFLWLYDGFSRIRSKFILGGSYDFRRPDEKAAMTFDDKLYIMENWRNIARYV
ncbi:MAG: hypothetical protein IJM55_02200 [Ruminococcus sp.]|nr:hypothetical protein [Ruminococcus sp.]